MTSFHTKYKIKDDFPEGQRGLTFKEEMIPTPTKYKEMTICFRVKMDYFTIIGDYISLVELLDGGGWSNGVEVKQFQERTISFQIRWIYSPYLKGICDKIINTIQSSDVL